MMRQIQIEDPARIGNASGVYWQLRKEFFKGMPPLMTSSDVLELVDGFGSEMHYTWELYSQTDIFMPKSRSHAMVEIFGQRKGNLERYISPGWEDVTIKNVRISSSDMSPMLERRIERIVSTFYREQDSPPTFKQYHDKELGSIYQKRDISNLVVPPSDFSCLK